MDAVIQALPFEIWWGLLDLIGIDQFHLEIKSKEI
jgi:hypothetical protein